MRHSIGLLLAGTLLVSACQVQLADVAATAKKASAATSPKKETKAPTTEASASPRASTAPSTPVTSSSPSIAAPTEPMTELKGTVKIDGSYLLSTGGGTLIGQAGGNVIATGGGNLIGQAGGNVIATGGGNLIGQAGGNVIAVGGGNLIGQAGGNYRTFAADALPLGTIVPVKGMVVVPVSLDTDRQVGPAVFSNERGEYVVSIPEALKGKVRLYAAVPAKTADDPLLKDARLWYNLLASTGTADAVAIDEDTVQISQLLRETFRKKFVYYMALSTAPGADQVDPNAIVFDEGTPTFHIEALKLILGKLQAMVKAQNLTTEAEISPLARRLADRLLGELDLSKMPLNSSSAPGWTGPQQDLVPYLVELMSDVRLRAQEKMVAGAITANYVETIQPQIDQANLDLDAENVRRAARGEKPYSHYPDLPKPYPQIVRPSDLTSFMVNEFLTSDNLAFERLEYLFDDLTRPGESAAQYAGATKNKIDMVGKVISYHFAIELLKFANQTYQADDPEVKADPSLLNKNKLDVFGEQYSKEKQASGS